MLCNVRRLGEKKEKKEEENKITYTFIINENNIETPTIH